MLSPDELARLKALVDAGKISDEVAFTTEPLEELLEIPEDADEATIRKIEEENELRMKRNKERIRRANKLRELISTLSSI